MSKLCKVEAARAFGSHTTQNSGDPMLRRLILATVGLMAVMPSGALACGMYVPGEKAKLLAEVLEEIDQQAVSERNRKSAEQLQEAPAAEGPSSPSPAPAPGETPPPTETTTAPAATPGPTASLEPNG